jgi:tRNA dimethylallyltransferase
MTDKYDIIVITGPTATGKTRLAALIASAIGSEVISADSRQIYRGMDIGTGKDIDDYIVNGITVPCHLIDIVEAGYRYNVFEYQRDFLQIYDEMHSRALLPVVCGGSGMYVDSIVSGYRLIQVPVNDDLRGKLDGKNLEELTEMLSGYKNLHNTTDVDTVKRAVRAIEIEEYYLKEGVPDNSFPEIKPLIIGLFFDRDIRRERISMRLKERMNNGMIEEVKRLLDSGLHPDDLIYYGLEYKYITLHLLGSLSYDEMYSRLETEIHRFAKRQMTWFRGMERKGIKINWIDGSLPEEDKVKMVLKMAGFEDQKF